VSRAAQAVRVLSVITDRTTLVLSVVAGLLLLSMVAVISAGVAGRYFFATPILGLNEIVQLNAVALTMLALPYTTASGQHVRADIFDRLIGRVGRFTGDVVTRALSLVVLYYMVDRAWAKMLDAREFGDATNMLALPIWPFYGLIAAGMGLCIVVFVIQLIDILASGRPVDE
tara:strand:- start:49031 stop:49546 length:516 start_codon:yes stop_codon:yes gene_type:complete